MAIRAFTGFECGNFTSNADLAPSSGTTTIVSTSPRSGNYCGRINMSSGANYFSVLDYATTGSQLTAFSIVNSYIQFYFKYAIKNTTGDSYILAINSASSTRKMSVRLNSEGKLMLYALDNLTVIGTGTTVLSADTWYKINVMCGTGATAAYELKINDVTELSGTYNVSTSNSSHYYFGSLVTSEAIDFFYDDIVLDDAAYPNGNAEVKALIPIANGSTMSWTQGTGASDYTQLVDIPLNAATYIKSPTTGNPNIALFDMESCATKGISGTILGLKALVATMESVSTTSAMILRIKSGATNSDNAAYNGTTILHGRGKLQALNPATSSAWTTATIDAVEIGVVENNVVATVCASVIATVLYIPSSTPAANTTNFFNFI